MRILAFDTATAATTVALAHPHGKLVEARDDPPSSQRPGHVSRLMPLIAQLLEEGEVGLGDLDRIAVGVGPGTFTGLRIGIATARALASANGIPLVGVSTLQSLATTAILAQPDTRLEAVLPVLDARRGEVFAASWLVPELPSFQGALLAPRAIDPEELAGLAPSLGARVLAIGDGAVKFRGVLEHPDVLIPEDESDLHRVSARGHCRIGASLYPGAPDEVLPEYLRLPDAELAHRAVHKR